MNPWSRGSIPERPHHLPFRPWYHLTAGRFSIYEIIIFSTRNRALKKGVIEKTAAVYLVLEDLRRGADVSNLDRFHWIAADHGLLSTPELLAIAREVWP